MNFLEKDLENIIYETNQSILRARGLYSLIYDSIERQVNLGSYGICDLVTCNHDEVNSMVTIYELKRGIVDASTMLQAAKYTRAFQKIVDEYHTPNHTFNFGMVLIGNEIQLKGEFCFLPSIFDNIEIYTYDYKYDGIYFTQHRGYKIANPVDTNQTLRRLQKSFLKGYRQHYKMTH